jgi:tetratricopeptide (TPR) repeat protein
VLLDKANYWRLKDRPDLAAEALNQLLEINPNHPDALFQYGMLEVQQNKPAEAQRYLAKLQQVAPNSPHIADLQSAIRAGQISPNELGEARRLAQSGQMSEAVQKYQQVFKGPPPSSYGVEYYMTLGGTPQGWDEARQGLERLSKASPNDAQIKLALGQLYTYREPTRMDGIAMLAQLSKSPVVGPEAVKAWRQALTWLGGNPQSKAAYTGFLAQYPEDADIRQLLADLEKQPAAPVNEAQSKAYDELKRGNLAAAEREFLAELQANPNDPQGLTGLGLVRLRQQRFTEARDLLGRAMHAAPEQQQDLATAYDSAMFWSRVNEAKALAAHKNYAAAASLLNGLLAHPHGDSWGAALVLADIEAKQGHNAAAEAAYRRALHGRPGNPDALVGLASVLKAENKTAEADAIIARLTPAQRARLAGPGNAGEKLRNEAKEASSNGDTAGAAAKYQAAIAADPQNPWIRFDYARFLAGQNQLSQASAAVDPRLTGNTPTSILVSAMFDVQQDRWAVALDKIRTIPADRRTKDIQNFYDRIYVRGTIDRAKELDAAGNTAQARNMLIALYRDPNARPDDRRGAVQALFHDLHDREDALRISREAYLSGTGDTVRAGIDYAMFLVLVGHRDAEAAQVVAQIAASGKVGDDNREDFQSVQVLLAIRQADALRDRGDYAGAYDQISPLLVARPNDASLLLAAGRIFASAGRYQEALDQFDQAYQQDPSNIDNLRGVVSGVLMTHDLAKADAYLEKGMEADPQNPWLFFLKAQIEEARGDKGAALRALQTARALNRQQNASAAGASPTDTTAPTALVPPAGPARPSQPPNPFRRSENTVAPAPAPIDHHPQPPLSVGAVGRG